MRILLAFIFLVSANCYSKDLNLLPLEEAERRIRMLDYDKYFRVISLKKYRDKPDYEIFKVTLSSISPVTKMAFDTNFYWYKPKLVGKNKKPLPLIIISPPVVGVDPMEKLIATGFVAGKPPFYNTFILDYGEKINDKERPIAALNNSFMTSITQGRLLIDFAETQMDSIDSKKIACYGMSLGGIMSTLLLEVDPRVDAAIVIVGGGNFPEILRESVQSIVKGYREARMKAENIKTLDELEKKLRSSLLYDPLYFAYRRPPRDIYMVIALEDTAVPTKNQLELYEAFRRPQSIQYHLDHAPAIFKNLPRHKPIMDFLEWRLGLEK